MAPSDVGISNSTGRQSHAHKSWKRSRPNLDGDLDLQSAFWSEEGGYYNDPTKAGQSETSSWVPLLFDRHIWTLKIPTKALTPVA